MPTDAPEWTIVDFIHRGWWWNNHGILILNMFLCLPLMTATANGLDSSIVNGLQIIPDWQSFYNHPRGVTLGLINSAQSIGGLVGLPFAPLVADSLGRRAALFIGAIIMVAGVALQAAAWEVYVFIISRVMIGIALSFCLTAAPLLLIELSYPTQRGRITAVYNSIWYIGSIISAWVCYGAYLQAEGSQWSFRVPTIVQGIIPLIQVCLVWLMPESPRFLVAKGLEGRAARILARFHADDGDERDPLVVFELAQIRHALRLEEEINKSVSYWSLFTSSGNRKRMRLIIALAMFSQWSGNGLVSYYINLVLEGVGITSTGTKAQINGGLQVFNLVIATSSALLVDKVGRRKLFIISNTGMLIVFVCWTITTALFNTQNNTAAAKATIPLVFLFFLAYDIAYTPLLVAYCLEILPFRVRARGFAVMNLTVYLTIAWNQFVNPVALDRIGWKYYIVYCCWLVFELLFVLKYIVETKGRTLEECAALFDGDQQPADLAVFGGEAATMTMSRAAVFSNHRRIDKESELHELQDLTDSESGNVRVL